MKYQRTQSQALIIMVSLTCAASCLSADVTPVFQGLGTLPGATTSQGLSISADGTAISGSSGRFAFRWTLGGGMQNLGMLPERPFTRGYGISGDGTVVVGNSQVQGT